MDDMYYQGVKIVWDYPKAGCIIIGDDLKIFLKRKPHAVARFLYRLLLDWKWEDAK